MVEKEREREREIRTCWMLYTIAQVKFLIIDRMLFLLNTTGTRSRERCISFVIRWYREIGLYFQTPRVVCKDVKKRFAPQHFFLQNNNRPVIAFGHLVQLVNSRSCGMRSICGFVVKLWDKFHLCSVIEIVEHGGLYWDFGVLNIFERVHQVLKFSKKFNEV